MSEQAQVEEDDFEAAFNAIAKGEEIDDVVEEEVEEEAEEVDGVEEPSDQQVEENQEEAPEDPWQGINPDIKAQFEKLQRERDELSHRVKSDGGRVSALQRKINELESARQSGTQTVQQRRDEAAVKAQLPEGFAEDYPDIAKAMQVMLEQTREQTLQQARQMFTQEVEPLKQANANRYVDEQDRILQTRYGDWRGIVSSAEFHDWWSTQPPAVQSLVQSDEASDAAYLIDSFNLSRGARQPAPVNTEVSAIAERRNRQLEQAESVPSKKVAQKQTVGDDFESAFKYFAKKATT